MRKPRAVVVHPEPAVAERLASALRRRGLQPRAGHDASALAGAFAPGAAAVVAVTPLHLEGLHAPDLQLPAGGPALVALDPRLVRPAAVSTCRALGVEDLLPASADPDRLAARAARRVGRVRARRELAIVVGGPRLDSLARGLAEAGLRVRRLDPEAAERELKASERSPDLVVVEGPEPRTPRDLAAESTVLWYGPAPDTEGARRGRAAGVAGFLDADADVDAAIAVARAALHKSAERRAGRFSEPPSRSSSTARRVQSALARVGEDLWEHTGQEFFEHLVEKLTSSLDVPWAIVSVRQDESRCRAVAVCRQGRVSAGDLYALEGSACERVLQGQTCIIERGLRAVFPRDATLLEHGVESYVGVPVPDRDGRPCGHLAVLSDRPMSEPGLVASLLGLLAARTGAELERQRSVEELRVREAGVRRASEVLTRLAREPALAHGDLEAAAPVLAAAAGSTLGVARVSLWLMNPDSRDMFSPGVWDRGRWLTPPEPLQRDSTEPYLRRIEGARLLVVEDATRDERVECLRDRLDPHGIGALLVAPVRLGSAILGAVVCSHVGGPRTWTEDECWFAASIADLTALGLEASRRRSAQQQIEQRNREVDCLRRVSEVLLESRTLGEALELLHPEIVEVVGLPMLLVSRYDLESDRMTAEWAGGLDLGDRGAEPFCPEELPAGRAIRAGRQFVCEDVPGQLAGEYTLVEAVGLASVVCSPLVSAGRTIGSLCLGDRSPRPLDAGVRAFAGSLANAVTAFLARRRAEEQEAQLKAQLLLSNKLESLGTLAGGVAHDFNNLLMGVLGWTWRLKQDDVGPNEMAQGLRTIENAAERAAELTHKLLGFARRGSRAETLVDLHEIVREAAALLRRTLGENVSMRLDLSAADALVTADPSQLHLMLLNLAVNARDAMPSGGELAFSTRTAELPSGPGGAAGPAVELVVEDSGEGIPAEHLERVFEPFFTTKDVGQGTGMGLATVHGIVQGHGGTIEVESAPGRGTRFRILLPCLGAPERAAPARAAPIPGRGHVLLVDDEPIVRETGAELLRELGYDVTTAADGVEAVQVFERGAGSIDVAVVDAVMPRMGGRECVQALRQVDADLPVVLASDWSLDGVEPLGIGAAGLALVRKPFQAGTLSRVLASMLGRGVPVA